MFPGHKRVKNKKNYQKAKRLIIWGSWILLMFIITGSIWEGSSEDGGYWEVYQFDQPVLRTHLVAHSLKPEERELKDKLQKELYSYLEAFNNTASHQEMVNQLHRQLPYLEEFLNRKLAGMGSEHTVETDLSKREFPLRRYGGHLYPSGEYLALSIKIGEGKGENWWCLLYPSLCFPVANPEDENSKNNASSTGTEDEEHKESHSSEENSIWDEWRLKLKDWLNF